MSMDFNNELIGKRIKVVNTVDVPCRFEELEKYINQTGVVYDYFFDDTFTMTFDDPEFDKFDYNVNSGVCFRKNNIEFLNEENDEEEISKEDFSETPTAAAVQKSFLNQNLSLTQLIQQIRKIIGNEYANVKLEIWSNKEINFCIYENEIVLSIKDKSVYVDIEAMTRTGITYDEMNELAQIMKLIQDNIDSVLECVKGE